MIQYTIGIYQKYKELVNYLIVGVLTTLVSWATYYVCVEWMLNPDIYWQLQVAVLLRWVSGVIFAYFTNRKYVFESKNKNIWKEPTQFTSSRLLTLFMDMFVMWLLVTALKMDDWVGTFVSAVLVTVTNYFLSKFLVFRKSKKE